MTSASLLRKAAEALEHGEDPFAGVFLAGNNVPFGQCMTLAEHLAIGARIVAYGIEHPASPEGQAFALAIVRSTS